MIKPSMRAITSRKRWGIYGVAVISLLLAAGVLFVSFGSRASAEGAWGDSGSGSGSTGSYYTTNGFGWKLFSITGDGPSGGFESGKWGSISDTSSIPGKCHATNDNKVWVHVVREPGGGERGYSYEGADYNRNRPAAGNDSYVFNKDGKYEDQGAAYSDKVIAIVAHVKDYYLEANPSGSGWGTKIGWFCWNDNPPWTLEASASVNKTVAEPGETITWTHTIKNNGENSTNVDVTGAAQNSQDLGSGIAKTWTFASGSIKNKSASEASTYLVTLDDYGKKLCRSTTATPGANTGGSVSSEAVCTIIAKRPKVHVLGGDLFVGRGSSTNPSRISNISTIVTPSGSGVFYGSWAEYAVIPTGTVRGMASGSGYGGGGASSALCSNSLLTFSNGDSDGCNSGSVGQYKPNNIADNIAARFPVTGATPVLSTTEPVDIASLSTDTIYTSAAGTISLTSSQKMPAGKWVVIHADKATVNITQNIEYSSAAFTSENDIPQLVIIANNIVISDAVTNVDAWLIAVGSGADGRLVTCDSAVTEPAQLTAVVCNKKLTVNGPVSVNHLYLYRTYGALGGTVSQAAEQFNLRADAYLWASSLDTTAYAKSVRTIELPPRY